MINVNSKNIANGKSVLEAIEKSYKVSNIKNICEPFFSEKLLRKGYFNEMEKKLNDMISGLSKLRESEVAKLNSNLTNEKVEFISGNRYKLEGTRCDGFEMKPYEYEYICDVNTVDDIAINSVIMKGDKENDGIIFTLTKNDCRRLGIDFQEGLQLFPKNMPWVEQEEVIQERKNRLTKDIDCIDKQIENVKNEIENIKNNVNQSFFERDNLSTYPHDKESGNIICMTFKIPNCKVLSRHIYGKTLYRIGDNLFTCEDLRTKLTIILKTYYGIAKINYRIITPFISSCRQFDIVDEQGNIFIEIHFADVGVKYFNTYGIPRPFFNNKNFEDLFDVLVNTVSYD